MKLVRPPKSVAPFGLSVMVQVARAAEGGMVDTHRALLDTAQRVVLGTELDVEVLPDADAATLPSTSIRTGATPIWKMVPAPVFDLRHRRPFSRLRVRSKSA